MTLRVLVVDDSLTVRKHIVEVLSAEPEMAVVGEAADGKAAIELCQQLRPDVVTMDMMLPQMTGLAATEYIMAYCPTPIVIVSASTNRGELFRTYDALAAGAVDVLDKPTDGVADAEWARRLVAVLKLAARVRVITHPRARLAQLGLSEAAPRWDRVQEVRPPRRSGCQLVAIGASTGGPGAVLNVLRGLPASFPLPVLVVIHIGATFAAALGDWLDGQIALPVHAAVDGQRVFDGPPGVWLAVPDRHLELQAGRMRLTGGPERHSCRPSVDVLFESIVGELGEAAIGCLLTGMGRDGASGLLALRQRGAFTIAQDEATSVVYGMPGEAVRLNAACSVLPLPRIALAICAQAGVAPPAEART
jgi:two-component system chemotaxis response regulator CheB